MFGLSSAILSLYWVIFYILYYICISFNSLFLLFVWSTFNFSSYIIILLNSLSRQSSKSFSLEFINFSNFGGDHVLLCLLLYFLCWDLCIWNSLLCLSFCSNHSSFSVGVHNVHEERVDLWKGWGFLFICLCTVLIPVEFIPSIFWDMATLCIKKHFSNFSIPLFYSVLCWLLVWFSKCDYIVLSKLWSISHWRQEILGSWVWSQMG